MISDFFFVLLVLFITGIFDIIDIVGFDKYLPQSVIEYYINLCEIAVKLSEKYNK